MKTGGAGTCDACQRIQDQIYMIESHMAGHESFTFNCSEEISNLHQVDLAVKRSIVTSYICALEEFKKLINNESSRRNIQHQINHQHDVIQKREKLKTTRRQTRLSKNPYKKERPCVE